MVTMTRSLSIASFALFSIATTLAGQQHYKQTNLVSDIPGMAAVTDPHLVNPWGLSRSSGSPWWASDNGTGLATLYTGTGTPVPLVVTIPSGDMNSSPTGTPTGQVFNGTNDFQLTPGNPARFIFVTEDGTISGWNPAVNPNVAMIKANTKSASVFKGVALASSWTKSGGTANFLYVADFRKARIAVYDTKFHRVTIDDNDDDDTFRDERLPQGYAPFNVQNIGGELYVAFAQQDSQKHDEVDGPGLGYVDVFSTSGTLLRRLQHGNWLNGPWGMTMAPSDFGSFSHHILVGQFGGGQIAAYDAVTGRFDGLLNDANNKPIVIDGLWDIAFGSGAPSTTGGVTSGPATSLFFTAGLNGEQDGLFGTITAVENVLGGDQ